MFSFFGKRFGSPSRCAASRRTYRPAFDTLEERAVPAIDAFIWFESQHGAVSGHQQAGQPAHQAFEIKDFSFGVENPTTIGSATGGAGAGKVRFNEFTITTKVDQASVAFFRNCVAGAHYKTVVIDLYNNPTHTGKPFLEYKFQTVFVTKIDWSGPGDEIPTEQITFVYGKLATTYHSR
jgi:type VI secretion system secreted protein Hcp